MPKFGQLRLVRDDVGPVARAMYRLMGVLDPAHYLHHLYLARAVRSLPSLAPRTILDAGCGAADHSVWLAQAFPGAEVLGIDVDRARLDASRKAIAALGIRNVRLAETDLTAFDEVERFDLVVSVDVLEHIVAQTAALRNLCRALRPGGVAVLHVPTRRDAPVPLSRWLGDFHAWADAEHLAEEASADEFLERMADAGFEVLYSRTTFGYWTGELATSLFALFHRNSPLNRLMQALLAPLCRILVHLDPPTTIGRRHAVLVVARRCDDPATAPRIFQASATA